MDVCGVNRNTASPRFASILSLSLKYSANTGDGQALAYFVQGMEYDDGSTAKVHYDAASGFTLYAPQG